MERLKKKSVMDYIYQLISLQVYTICQELQFIQMKPALSIRVSQISISMPTIMMPRL